MSIQPISTLDLPPGLTVDAFTLIKSPRHLRVLAIWIVGLLVVTVLCLIVVPWQQTVSGTGKVTVFSPMFRPQTIDAQLSGRLKHWLVKEGDWVKSGQVVAELVDIDPKFQGPDQVDLLNKQRDALMARRQATLARMTALENQFNALATSQGAAVPAAGIKIRQNANHLSASQQTVKAAQQAFKTAEYNVTRLKELYAKGLRSKRDYELAELDFVKAKTEVERAQAALRVAQQEVDVAALDRVKVGSDLSAAMANVSSSLATAQETLASTDNELSKLAIDIENMTTRVAQRQVRAPQTGRIVRLMSVGQGQIVTEGSPLAIVVPDVRDQAVELYLSDWDAPLVAPGRKVRLLFAGWPAIQFSGWPSVSVGTFAGVITVIDAVDNGQGKYRVLVKPDPNRVANDLPWPDPQHLRPGTTAHGWILLDTVPLGYELWRQFNGFRPTVKDEGMGINLTGTGIGPADDKSNETNERSGSASTYWEQYGTKRKAKK